MGSRKDLYKELAEAERPEDIRERARKREAMEKCREIEAILIEIYYDEELKEAVMQYGTQIQFASIGSFHTGDIGFRALVLDSPPWSWLSIYRYEDTTCVMDESCSYGTVRHEISVKNKRFYCKDHDGCLIDVADDIRRALGEHRHPAYIEQSLERAIYAIVKANMQK